MGGAENANLGAEKLRPLYDKICQLDIPVAVHDTASTATAIPIRRWSASSQLFL